jgi:AP-1-like transcription factor
MSSSDTRYELSPNQQELLVAALASNQPSSNKTTTKISKADTGEKQKGNKVHMDQDGHVGSTNGYFNPDGQTVISPGEFLDPDASPYLGFDLDADGDDQFDFDGNDAMIDGFTNDASQLDPSDLHEKRKSIDDKEDDEDEGGGKRRESEGATGKKPGRKPLTAEPTTVSCPC